MSKLELLNRVVQVLFIRIYKSYDRGILKGYGVLYFIVPFTGWDNDFKSIFGGLRFSKIMWK